MAHTLTDEEHEQLENAVEGKGYIRNLTTGGVQVIPPDQVPVAHIETFCQFLGSQGGKPWNIGEEVVEEIVILIRRHLIEPYYVGLLVNLGPEDGPDLRTFEE